MLQSDLQVIPMNEIIAAEIITWKYPPPFEVYSFNGTVEEQNELMDGSYYAVLTNEKLLVDGMEQIIGYFCTGEGARVPGGYKAGIYQSNQSLSNSVQMPIDIGLGMNPNITSKGFGATFLEVIMQHIYQLQGESIPLQLVVLASNVRARKVYSRTGYQELSHFQSPVKGEELEFVYMVKKGGAIDNC